MNRLGLVSACLTFLLVGCGEDPTLTVVAEPAGANCPTGGFRVDADGEVFYSCNESQEVLTREVAAGADGNPCIGAALLVTVTLADGSTRDAYACQPLEVDETARDFLLLEFTALMAQAPLQCLCSAPEDQAQCQGQLELYDSVGALLNRCVTEAVAVAAPLPEAVRPYAECIRDGMAEVATCWGAIEAIECSVEVEEAAAACGDALDDDMVACGELLGEDEPALDRWTEEVGLFAQFLGCPIFGS